MKKTSAVARETSPATPAPVPAKKKSTAKPKIGKIEQFPAPAIRASAAVETTITAKIDVGFGNTLYVRGEGPGLSWEKGVPLDCVDDDKWSLTLPESSRPIVFKFLLNDLTWCTGDDFVAQPGQDVTVTPAF